MMRSTIFAWAALASLLMPRVLSHATQVRHCLTPSQDLRIFIQHWHGSLYSSVPDDTIEVKDVNNVSYTIAPAGVINNENQANLYQNGCDSESTAVASDCASSYDDWVYFDIPAYAFSETFTIVGTVGAGVLLLEGCAAIYPVTFQTGWYMPSVNPSVSTVPSISALPSASLSPSSVPSISTVP